MGFKLNLTLVRNFRPKGWSILYIKLGVGRPSLSKTFLNFLKDFALRNRNSNLSYSRVLQGKNEYLKAFVLQMYVPTKCIERISYVLFLRGINL